MIQFDEYFWDGLKPPTSFALPTKTIQIIQIADSTKPGQVSNSHYSLLTIFDILQQITYHT